MNAALIFRFGTIGTLLLGALSWCPLAAPSSSPLVAQEEDPSPHSDAWLLSEVMSIQAGVPFTVAVRFEMEPSWHNYWRNAGDSGLPTTIEWDLPPGFQAGDIQWPYPARIALYPLVDYGYSDKVALLVEISPPEDLLPGTAARLSAAVDWLICHEICLPAYAELEIELPVAESGPQIDGSLANLFAEARARLPRRLEEWGFEAEATESGYRLIVEPRVSGLAVPEGVYFFPAEVEILDHATPQGTTPEDGTLTLTLPASPYAQGPAPVLRGVLVSEAGGSWLPGEAAPAMEVEVEVQGVPPGGEATEPAGSTLGGLAGAQQGTIGGAEGGATLLLALVFAFIGGVLLNLMPCVFPVLSLKILSVAGKAGEGRGGIRSQGLFFGAGVLSAFLALAGLLLILRAGGSQLGWGFQLQSPYFVACMAALFFAIGLNLMGVFEVGVALTRLGGRLDGSGGAGESFASGVLATVIATPCTAPFMGAALGFALSRSVMETLVVFGTLGLGMALPYVALSLAPGLLERLPRPGPWMETLRNVLAFPMFATVIWLVWVFGQQTGMGGAASLLSALLLLSASGWMVGRWHRTDLRSGLRARALSVVLLAIGGLLVARGTQSRPPLAQEDGWEAFSQSQVAAHLAQGRPVFIDFTAAWCLTCQVNERLVLSSEGVLDAFRAGNVALLKADWTRQDPEITTALEGFGRSGVPLYVLYGGSPSGRPHILPALLTDQIVLDALGEVLSPRNSI
ncbi:protein-disulfide reductase DsbD family protein [Gemmatimonadota bacterium]